MTLNFKDLKLSEDMLEGISAMGFNDPTPIQEQAIPTILEGNDLVGCAQTGTGKTAAYLIPVIENISKNSNGKIQCIIIAPTRELAQQIDQQAQGFTYFTPISSCAVYGGNQPKEWEVQRSAIQKGVELIIATPGRLISHINLGYMDLSSIKTLILDEADRMLDMGFYDDIMKIINELPEKEQRQTLLFSATMPDGIRKLSNKILNNPKEVSIAVSKPAEGVTQTGYMVFDDKKIPLLEEVIKNRDVKNMIIFASTKRSVGDISQALKKLGIDAKSIHSGKSQEERNEALRLFKAGKLKILVATDILSRGIDIEGLSHVLNYDVPEDPEDYVHRIGRTARAEKDGEAITFINIRDQYKVDKIEKLIGSSMKKLNTPEKIGKSPHYKSAKKRNFKKGGKKFHKKGGPRKNKQGG